MGCTQSGNNAAVADASGASTPKETEEEKDVDTKATNDFAKTDDENTATMLDLTQNYSDDLMQQVALLDQVYGVNVKATKKKGTRYDDFTYTALEAKQNNGATPDNNFDVQFERNSSNSDASKGTHSSITHSCKHYNSTLT